MYFSIKIFSKNKISLNKFLLFISRLDFPIKIINNFPKLKKKFFLTVLKSPHVNKDAQEQFEFRVYSKELIIWSPQSKILLLIFKKAIFTSFSSIKIRISVLSNTKTQNSFLLNSLDPQIYDLNFFDTRKKKSQFLKKVVKYLNLNDCYGDIAMKKTFSE